jgi:hypothetical protein
LCPVANRGVWKCRSLCFSYLYNLAAGEYFAVKAPLDLWLCGARSAPRVAGADINLQELQ